MGETESSRVSSSFGQPPVTRQPAVLPQPTKPSRVGAVDPLSRPYTMPSRGIYYPDGYEGEVVLSPMRGAQEEVLAAARGTPQATMQALRHVMEQCVDLQGIEFDDLLVDDWAALMLHFFALSAGTDEVRLKPHCPGCGRESFQVCQLTQLPCRELRVAKPGEPSNWPPSVEDNELASFLASMGEAEQGPQIIILSEADAQEPFRTDPMPVSGDVLTWRLHRLRDVKRAEQYAQHAAGTGAASAPGSKMHSFLLASHILEINGERAGPLAASNWVRNQPTSALNVFRGYIREREFGYDVNPMFSCQHCGRSFRGRLPLDGSMFRGRPRSRS